MIRRPIKRTEKLSEVKTALPEFFLIISPSREVCRYVSFLKHQVKHSLGHSFDSDSSKAHISLLKYQDRHNESLLYRMQDIISAWPPFTIHLKNFGVFHHGINRTIYIDIVNKVPICDLAEELTGRQITPHITIAKNLEPADFAFAWPSLRSASCRFDFECNHITVLKRSINKWIHHLDIALMGLGVANP